MSGHSSYVPSNGVSKWVDSRLPLPRMLYDSFVTYPVPRNLNYAYTFGAMLWKFGFSLRICRKGKGGVHAEWFPHLRPKEEWHACSRRGHVVGHAASFISQHLMFSSSVCVASCAACRERVSQAGQQWEARWVAG